MNRFTGAVLLTGIVAMVFGCGKDPDLLNNQQRGFASYFQSRGYDSLVRGGVYVHIPNAGRDGRDLEPILDWGDSLHYYYEIYPFAGFSAASIGNPSQVIATNNAEFLNNIPGLNPKYLDSSVAKAKLGSTGMIEGIKRGLRGSSQRDSVWLFMTSDLAYGESTTGIIEANTPLVFVINLKKVKKQE